MECFETLLGLSTSKDSASHFESASLLAVLAVFLLSYTHKEWGDTFPNVRINQSIDTQNVCLFYYIPK